MMMVIMITITIITKKMINMIQIITITTTIAMVKTIMITIITMEDTKAETIITMNRCGYLKSMIHLMLTP